MQPPAKRARYVPPAARSGGTSSRASIYGDQGAAQNTGAANRPAPGGDGPVDAATQRAVRALLNRLARASLPAVSESMVKLFQEFPGGRSALAQSFASALISQEIQNTNSQSGVGAGSAASAAAQERTAVQAALICVLHTLVGPMVTSCVLFHCASRFAESWQQPQMEQTDSSSACAAPFRLLVQLFQHKVWHGGSESVFMLLKSIAGRFSSVDVELLLIAVQMAGKSLRKDDPGSLRDLILLVQERKKPSEDSFKKESELVANPARVEHLLQLLYDLKNNRVRSNSDSGAEQSSQLRKLTHAIFVQHRKDGHLEPPVRLSWAQLVAADSRGQRMFDSAPLLRSGATAVIVAGSESAVAAASASASASASLPSSAARKRALRDAKDDTMVQAHELARKHHMNTETRRTVFVILVTAADADDALLRLGALALSKHQQATDVIPVLLHLAGSEGAYNPFYALLATKLAHNDRSQQFALRCAIWDRLKLLQAIPDDALDADDDDDGAGGEREGGKGDQARASTLMKSAGDLPPGAPMPLASIANLAKLLATLVGDGTLPLTVLKPVEWMSLGPYAVLFMRVFLTALLTGSDGGNAISRVCALSNDGSLVDFKEGLAHFLRLQRAHSLQTQKKMRKARQEVTKESRLFAKACKSAAKALETSLSSFE